MGQPLEESSMYFNNRQVDNGRKSFSKQAGNTYRCKDHNQDVILCPVSNKQSLLIFMNKFWMILICLFWLSHPISWSWRVVSISFKFLFHLLQIFVIFRSCPYKLTTVCSNTFQMFCVILFSPFSIFCRISGWIFMFHFPCFDHLFSVFWHFARFIFSVQLNFSYITGSFRYILLVLLLFFSKKIILFKNELKDKTPKIQPPQPP